MYVTLRKAKELLSEYTTEPEYITVGLSKENIIHRLSELLVLSSQIQKTLCYLYPQVAVMSEQALQTLLVLKKTENVPPLQLRELNDLLDTFSALIHNVLQKQQLASFV
jgi:hypothetical protein